MGQGHYTCLVWGEAFEGDVPDAIIEWCDGLPYPNRIRSGYQAEPTWIGAVAVNDGQSNCDEGKETLEYTAVAVDDLTTRYAEAIADARKAWDDARATCPELGEGRLLLVADYD